MLGSIEEPEVTINVPKAEFECLKENLKTIPDKNIPDGLKKKLINDDGQLKLVVEELRWVRENVDLGCPLHEWVSKCEVVLPQPPVIPRNPELEARVQRLKLEQQERDYMKMTKNVDNMRAKYPDESIASQIKAVNRQLIAVLQFIVSVGAGFAFGFIGIQLMVGDLDFGFRLLLGVICALVIALAEIYFLAKYLAAEDNLVSLKPHQD